MAKKLFTLLLAIVASIGTMFASTKIGDLYYNLDATRQRAEVTSQNSSYPYWSTAITTAIIPASVTYNSVTYSVTSIGSHAFYNCTDLTSVTIPNSVTSIKESAFRGCTGLTSPVYNAHVFAYMPTSYSGAYTIPDGIESIAGGAFYNCTGLTSVTIPNSVTSIEESAFRGCTGLTSPVYNAHVFAYMPTSYSGAYTIPDGIESIAGGAFYNCSGLTSVTIPNSVTSIEGDAFYNCSGLTSVTIGNSVTWIGNSAFYNCSGLTSITCEAITPPTLSSNVFFSVDKSIPLYVPAESVEAYQTADQWKDFTNILPISQQGLEDVQGNNVQYTKVVRDGQIYILRGEKTYTITGQEMK